MADNDHSKTDSSQQSEIETLKHKVRGIKDKLKSLLTSTHLPEDPPCSAFFPNVDPTKIKRPVIPTKAPFTGSHPEFHPDEHPSHNIDTAPSSKATPDVIPYGSRVLVCRAGQALECWIQKCYLLHNGVVEYDGSTSSGENIRFQARDVFLHDITATPRKTPDDYIYDHTQQRHEGPMGYHQHANDEFTGNLWSNTTNDQRQSGRHQNPGGLYRHDDNRYHGMQFHDDDHSNTSNQADSTYHTPRMCQNSAHRRQHNHQYAQNAFVYPKGTVPQYIREDKASSTGKAFTAHLGSNEDPRDFYKEVRQEVIPHKVLLRAYDMITRNSGILEINNWNCDNYESARKVMSRYLYIFFVQGKDTMFDANAYARNSLVNYERDQDGLSFLYSLIKDHHTDLCSTVHRANITDAYTLPNFDDDMSLWRYIHMMQIYFKEVNKQATQVDILRLIHAQLCKDPRFTKAAEHLQGVISEHKTGNGSVPEEYRLKDIACTIMDQYDPSEREKLSESRRPSRFGTNTMQINRMRTRSQRQARFDQTTQHYGDSLNLPETDFTPKRNQYDQRRNKESTGNKELRREQDKVHEQCTDIHAHGDNPADTLCIGCWTYGHPVEECTKTGSFIAIDAFLTRCTEQTKREIKAAYRKNCKEAHERYLRAFKRRQELRKKIQRLEFQYHKEPTSTATQNEQEAMAELDALKISCIHVAHDEDPDLDFGSLDQQYIDTNEPMLKFDPSVENFPTDNE